MARKLAQVIVQPVFVDIDEEGEVEQGPYHLATPQGQPIQFTVSAKEWRAGWDLDAAVTNVTDQMGLGLASKTKRPVRKRPSKGKSMQGAKKRPKPKR